MVAGDADLASGYLIVVNGTDQHHGDGSSTKKLGGTERAANSRSCHGDGSGGERA
jgi:hypothetical protein